MISMIYWEINNLSKMTPIEMEIDLTWKPNIYNQGIAGMNKMKAGGLELCLFLLFAFHLPVVPRASHKKLKGATEHL